MNTNNDGGPAFPSPTDRTPTGEVNSWAEPGMSLRDWFAGQALAGLLACPDPVDAGSMKEIMAKLSLHAYGYADAMLAARKEKLS